MQISRTLRWENRLFGKAAFFKQLYNFCFANVPVCVERKQMFPTKLVYQQRLNNIKKRYNPLFKSTLIKR